MNLQKIKLGLVALVLGFGLVATQSAFKPVESGKFLVEYGVLDEQPTRYRITPNAVNPVHDCGNLSIPCSVTFDETSQTPYQDTPGGNWFLDKDPSITEKDMGGYVQ